MRSIKEGIDAAEDTFVYSLSPSGFADGKGQIVKNAVRNLTCAGAELRGDVVVVKPQALDAALWKLGGAAVALRLTELASVCDLTIV